jgi:hypothetical protein
MTTTTRGKNKHSKLKPWEKLHCISSAHDIPQERREAWLITEYPSDFAPPCPDPIRKLKYWCKHIDSQDRCCSYGLEVDRQLADRMWFLLNNHKPVTLDILRANLSDLLYEHGKAVLFSRFNYATGWAIAFCKRHGLPSAVYSIVNTVFSTVGPRSLHRCVN